MSAYQTFMNLLFKPNKKHDIKIIIFFVILVFAQISTFASEKIIGPVIASVNINSCEGSITIAVTSGVAPYTYVWKDSGGNILPSTVFIADNLVADNYTVTVTDDNGDSVTATYTVTNPPDLTGVVVVNDVTCRGDADAQVVVTMNNGNPAFDWVLTNSGGAQVATGNVGGIVISIGGLGVDSYSLVITDLNGCTGTINFIITEPANFLNATLVTLTDATCSNLPDGSLQVVGSGGWGGYTYQWIRVSNGSVVANTAAIGGLTPDDYRVFITDSNGCIVNATYTINSPTPILTTPTITHVTCNGLPDGSIDITVFGGTGAYTYLWSTGATTQDVSGLVAGNYSVVITDASACVFNENFTVTEPNVLTINESITDVDCFGDNSGQIESNVSGGTLPYTYLWSTGDTSEDLNNVVAGTYTLVVSDANGCDTNGSYTINEPTAALSVQSTSSSLPSCFSGSDGSLGVSMTGGTSPYSYLWSNGNTNATVNALTAGNYSVTITDTNGCQLTESYTLNNPIKIALSPTLVIPSCNGGNDGSITVSASNGTAPYTYNWNTGDTGPTAINLTAGSYTVTVSDANACTISETIALGEPTAIAGNAAVNDISCNGQIDGSIFLTVTGGTAPYTYSWNTGVTTNNISGLSAGNYSVNITDGNGCLKVENFTIIEPAAIAVSFTKQDVLCKGLATGAIDITPSGGTAPYSFTWSNGSTTEDQAGLAAGNYSVTIKDASNCSVIQNITIDEPVLVLNVTEVITNVSCNGGNNGSIDVTATGGVSPYSYSWNTGATSEDLTNAAAGNYSLQITDDNGCVKVFSYTVTAPTPLTVGNNLSDVSCNGADDGVINLTPSGGTAPYSYIWNDGNTTSSRMGLPPANYTVTITDANGCQNNQNFTINEPLVLSNSFSKQDVLCFGQSTGIINISPSGGTTPYTFLWSNGATTEDISAIPSGNYTVTITDTNGCTLVENITILEPAAALSFSDNVGQITCNGATDGAIALTVAGGVAPYTYNWSNGSTNQDLNALSPGNYNVVITDANGCSLNSAYTITDPALLTSSGVISDVTCFGASDGSIDFTVVGGEAPYTFIWSHGGNTEDVSGLPPGTFTVQVVDNRGCSIAETFTINGPTSLGASHVLTDVDCFGNNNGSINLTVTGGTAPYTFLWSNGASTEDVSNLIFDAYTVTITDANGCQLVQVINVAQPALPLTITETVTDISCFGSNNGSVELVMTGGTAPYSYVWDNGATTKDIFGLLVGNYQLTVTDANGCTTSGTYTINTPLVLQLSAVVQNLSCNNAGDGAIDITVVGGVAPYTYSWSNGGTSEDLNSLSEGDYQVQVIDANGCSLSRTYTVTAPLPITATATLTAILCFGVDDAAIELNVTGGVAPYSYLWSNGAVTKDIFNISGGVYSVTITDAKGCQVNNNYTINAPAAPIIITENIANVSCFGNSDGVIDLTISGGSTPYTFSWNQGAITEDIAGLNPGSYQITVTDANGCSVSNTYTVLGPDKLQISYTNSNLSCNAANDGAIDITINGGTAPFSFNWSNGSTTEDISNLSAGSYQVLVVDANGCSLNQVIIVQEPAVLALSYSKGNIICFEGNTGSIDLTIAGGSFPYTFSWSNGSSVEDLTGLVAGNYNVVVTDVNGCTITETISLSGPASAIRASAILNHESCNGLSDGTIDLTVNGGVAPYSFTWNNGKNTEDIVGLAPGTYIVTITDTNGCSLQASYDVVGPTPLLIYGVKEDISCFQSDDGRIDINISGGTAPYTFSWSNGSTNEDLSGLSIGNYSLTVTDANGCTSTKSFIINQPLPLIINYQTTEVACFAQVNGSINLSITGGTGPYTYSWASGQTSQDISGLAGGSYSVTVVDNQGCSVSQNVDIIAPSEAITVSENIINSSCNGQLSGQIELTVTGGTAPYNYQWSNGSSQKNLVNMNAGVYDLVLIDQKGCVFTATYEILQPITIEATFDVESSTCLGDTDGWIITTATGGIAPYTYVWNNGSTSKDQYNLTGGTYNVTITDVNGCSVNKAVTVESSRSLNVAVIKTNVWCKGESNGTILLDITGGSGSYIYLWSTGEATQNLNDLGAGVYNVTITDTGGCATTASVVISEPSQVLTVQLSQSAPLVCNGDDGGAASVQVSGGVAPYTYLWSTGAQTSGVQNLKAGNYSVAITDSNGCLVQREFTITQPVDPIQIAVFGNTELRCNGQNDASIRLEVDGGNGPYTFLWSNGSLKNEIDQLVAGNYTVRVKDASGCTIEKVIKITEPEILRIANVNVNQSKCFDDRNGAIELEIEGGTRPYIYQWSTGATTKNIIGITSGDYFLTVIDARGCEVSASYTLLDPALFKMNPDLLHVTCIGANDGLISLNIEGGLGSKTIRWNTGESTETIKNLAPGNYNVVVIDENECSIQQDFIIIEPLALTLDAYVEDAVECGEPKSGKISMIVSGGSDPYTYRWSNGATSSTIEDILPGTYVVTVTDRNGCQSTGTYSVQQPEPLQIGLSTFVVVDCITRTVTSKVIADVVGGTGSYTYEWNIGNSISEEIILSAPARLTLVIYDGLGCSQTRSIDVRIPDLADADYTYQSDALDRDGELAANDKVEFYDQTTGEAIDWSWDFGDGFTSSEVDPIHTFDAPGIFKVVLTVIDASGCTSIREQTLEITEGYRVMFPTAFTPNSDGNNDFFRPKLLGFKKVQMHVFNTWGELIFSTNDLETKGWDGKIRGKPAENGNYVFKIIGESHNGLFISEDGIFALIK